MPDGIRFPPFRALAATLRGTFRQVAFLGQQLAKILYTNSALGSASKASR
jgi:hypothetical protein